jgi:Phytanoyl-CoA dioxygenase (PhyH)
MPSRLSRVLRRSSRGDDAGPVAAPPPDPGERLWIDGPDVAATARARTDDAAWRRHAEELATAGITKLEGAIATERCDQVRREYEAYCDAHADEAAVFADESGFRSRLANFHLASDAALAIGADPGVMALLDFLFGHRAAIFSSLIFERGTQQDVHRDTPYFCTEPAGFFFGVWTALEDISPDAGPLVYFEGAHRIDLDPRALAAEVYFENAQHPDRPPRDPGRVFNAEVAERARAAALPRVSPTARKGDTLIWHPDLPHGGSAIVDPGLTRASIVFHCAPEGVPVYGPERFYGLELDERKGAPRYRWANGRAILDQGAPSFEPND